MTRSKASLIIVLALFVNMFAIFFALSPAWGQEVTATTHPVRAPVIDLMDALRKSINAKPAASASKKPPVRSISSGSSASQATQSSRKSSKKAVG